MPLDGYENNVDIWFCVFSVHTFLPLKRTEKKVNLRLIFSIFIESHLFEVRFLIILLSNSNFRIRLVQ